MRSGLSVSAAGGIISGAGTVAQAIYDYQVLFVITRASPSCWRSISTYAGQVPVPVPEKGAGADAAPRRIMQLNFYCMPAALAQKYQKRAWLCRACHAGVAARRGYCMAHTHPVLLPGKTG